MKCLACGIQVLTFEQWFHEDCDGSGSVCMSSYGQGAYACVGSYNPGHDIGEFQALPMEGEE